MTFDPHKKLGGEPGEFYPVSDVKGREDSLTLGYSGSDKQRIAWHGDGDYHLNLELAVCAEERRACKRERGTMLP